MKLLLTLMLITFLFNSCDEPELQEKIVYVYKKQPNMKNKPKRDTTVENFKLYKKDSEDASMYLVNKKDLVKASKNMQKARKLIYILAKDARFYRYQNNKFNLLNKETNTTKNLKGNK